MHSNKAFNDLKNALIYNYENFAFAIFKITQSKIKDLK